MERDDLLRTLVMMMSVVVAILVGGVLYFTQDIFVPFVLAILGAYTVEPLVRGMGVIGVPRWTSAIVVVGLLSFAAQVIFGVMASSIVDLQAQIPAYVERVQSFVDTLPLGAGEAGRIRLDDPEFWQAIVPADALFGSVGTWARSITAIVGQTMLVLLLMVAIIIARARFDERLRRVASDATGHAKESRAIMAGIDRGIQRYMALKTLLSLVNGFLFALVLMAFEVEFAVLWGATLFLFNYIPTVGPVLGTIPAVILLILEHSGEPALAVAGVLCAGAVPTVFANVVEPKLFGEQLDLNFFAVVFALLLWGTLWGLPGAFLSVPITMAMCLVFREVPSLRPLYDLLRA